MPILIGSGNVEGLLEGLDELGQLDEGELLELLDKLFGGQLRHDGRSFLIRFLRAQG